MVGSSDPIPVETLDPVETLLIRHGKDSSAEVIGWRDGQREMATLRRKVIWSTVSAWMLVSSAAVIGGLVSWVLSGETIELIDGMSVTDFYGYGQRTDARPLMLAAQVVPWALAVVALTVVVGGAIAIGARKIPGLASTLSAIEWSESSDAVTRLLSVGCGYPEAFRTAASISQKKSSSRGWLLHAAQRVERGDSPYSAVMVANADSAIVELLVDGSGDAPQTQWRTAAEYFYDSAMRRTTMLIQSFPIIAMVLAGLLIWISISSSLSLIWAAVGNAIEDLNWGN